MADACQRYMSVCVFLVVCENEKLIKQSIIKCHFPLPHSLSPKNAISFREQFRFLLPQFFLIPLSLPAGLLTRFLLLFFSLLFLHLLVPSLLQNQEKDPDFPASVLSESIKAIVNPGRRLRRSSSWHWKRNSRQSNTFRSRNEPNSPLPST